MEPITAVPGGYVVGTEPHAIIWPTLQAAEQLAARWAQQAREEAGLTVAQRRQAFEVWQQHTLACRRGRPCATCGW